VLLDYMRATPTESRVNTQNADRADRYECRWYRTKPFKQSTPTYGQALPS